MKTCGRKSAPRSLTHRYVRFSVEKSGDAWRRMSCYFGMWWPLTGRATFDASGGVVFLAEKKVSMEKLLVMRCLDSNGCFWRSLECD